MEDLSRGGFIKLQDVLVSGDVAAHLPAIEGALAFIGRVHSATWLEEVESSKRRELIDNHRSVNPPQCITVIHPFCDGEGQFAEMTSS